MNKKYIILTCIIAVVTFIIGYFIGDASAVNRVNKRIDQNVKSVTNDNIKTTSNQEDKPDSSKEKVYKLGEEGKSGNWSIKVLDAKEATTIEGGDSSDNKTTSQKFIIVKLQMTDVAQTPQQYSTDNFMLGNVKTKKQYKPDMDAGGTANKKETIYNNNSEFFDVYEDINPNTPKQTYIAFEVPKDINIADCIIMNSNNNSDPVGFNLK